MGSTTKFRINGLVDTNNNVLDNISNLATHSGAFITWDNNTGKWTSILNSTAPSLHTFTDSNILGEINVTGTGMTELYNKVSISFPHKDIRDTTDIIDISLAASDRLANEIDNTLELELPQCNDPIQAQYIGGRELKQNRLDLIIEFRANYEANFLKAGDKVSVTNAGLNFALKEFRIIQIQEEDTDDGNLIYSITAQEYNETIYTATGLTYETRTHFNGIKSKVFNAEIDKADDADTGNTMARLLGANALLGIVSGLFKKYVTVDEETGVLTEDIQFEDKATQELMTAGAKKPPLTHSPAGSVGGLPHLSGTSPVKLCSGTETTLTVSHDCEVCFLNTPDYTYDYTISGLAPDEINIPETGEVVTSGTTATLTFTPTVTADTSFTVVIGTATTTYRVLAAPDEYISTVTGSGSITEGDSVTVTVTTVGKTDGDTVNYAITGDTTKISTALTGTVTLASNTADLVIATTDDSAFNASEEFVVTFTPQVENFCAITNNEITITLANNATTGVQPPANTTCEYQLVPIVWCGIYDGTTNALTGISVRRYAYLPIANAGETTVAIPLTCSVAGGNITIATTVDIATNSNIGGIAYQILTTGLSSTGTRGLIIGSGNTTVYGYDL